ncbi:MAG: suppressor of fused domain protein [Flavobacteriales bacterium]|nr:suppressor of fused domain protein [Flavobacteriales bacterium]
MFGLFKKSKKRGTSKGGSTIYEYEETQEEIGADHLSVGNESNIEEISDHIEKYIGKIEFVYHELISPLVHIDIHVVLPTPERNFYTLVTSGMSDRAMNIPSKELKGWEYAELMLCLPPEWNIKQEMLEEEENYWPIRMLKFMARFPHEYNTWLSFGHTIPNGNPPDPFNDDVDYTCALVNFPAMVNDVEKFFELKINDEKTIKFFGLMPIFESEMNFKLEKGTDALNELFDQHFVTELIDKKRKSVV